MSAVALLLQDREGNTYAVVCHSRRSADKIAEVSPWERLGTVPIINRVEALLGELNENSEQQ